MSYTLTIGCGCLIYVAAHPRTRVVHTRIIERRGGDCRVRTHDTGVRLQLWEMLPDPGPGKVLLTRVPAPLSALAHPKAS